MFLGECFLYVGRQGTILTQFIQHESNLEKKVAAGFVMLYFRW